jgi:hypothetical protein
MHVFDLSAGAIELGVASAASPGTRRVAMITARKLAYSAPFSESAQTPKM